MGNMRGWGGPLNSNWHNFTVSLQHKILERMRDLGIIPVLTAFAGHVPRAFSRIYPRAKVIKLQTWNDFGDRYCWQVKLFDYSTSCDKLNAAKDKEPGETSSPIKTLLPHYLFIRCCCCSLIFQPVFTRPTRSLVQGDWREFPEKGILYIFT